MKANILLKKIRKSTYYCSIAILITTCNTVAFANHANKTNKKIVVKKHAVHNIKKPSSQPLPVFINNPNQNSSNIANTVENIINNYGNSAHIGIVITDLNNNQIVYQRQATQLFNPASSLKVFTAITALNNFDATYTFSTKLFANSQQIDAQGTLHSNVYIKFSGDPTLTLHDLNYLIKQLKDHNVNSIAGNIYLDDTVFDRNEFGHGWMWDEKSFCYASPLGGINIDHNCIPVTVTPAQTTGEPIKITQYNGYAYLPLINQTQTRNVSNNSCPLVIQSDNFNNIVFSGCMQPNTTPWTFNIAIGNTRQYASLAIQKLLQQNNITQHGEIIFGSSSVIQQNLSLIAEHNSNTLKNIIVTMLKKSDNLYADAIYKLLGYQYSNYTNGSWINASKALAQTLGSKAGIDFNKIKIVDGCGLSRHNLVSPLSLVQALIFAYAEPKIRDNLINGLPLSGVDGHLENRLHELKTKIQAKTGTMKGITSLAGYIQTKSGKTFAFAIIVNDFVENVHKYQKLEDDICTVFYNIL